MSVQGNILIVDDLPDVRLTVKGILDDAGYCTHAVNSREDALAALQQKRFHVAVLDIRLDESDDENRDGLRLMHEIAEQDPSMAIIILTGYATVEFVMAALQQNGTGLSPAFSFLPKIDMIKIPEHVRNAFQLRLKLNLNLDIEDPFNCVDKLAKDIRVEVLPRPQAHEIADEIREVFCRLFSECERICVNPIQQGFSGAAVFQVTPYYENRGRGVDRIVKIGRKKEIDSEKSHYEKHIRGIVGGHRIPEKIDGASARYLSSVLYSFVGLDEQAESFSEFYSKAKPHEIISALTNLYGETLFPKTKRRIVKNVDLKEFYMNHLRLTEDKIKKSLERATHSKHLFSSDEDGMKIFGRLVIDPIEYAMVSKFHEDACFSVIHGDLYSQNILVDRHCDTWLIDFASTTDNGHLLQDHASLENNVRFALTESNNVESLFKWTKLSLARDLVIQKFPSEIPNEPNLVKAYSAIHQIRELASNTPGYSNRAYLTALFFNAVRTTTFHDLPALIRDHAFFCASVIAERLSKGVVYV